MRAVLPFLLMLFTAASCVGRAERPVHFGTFCKLRAEQRHLRRVSKPAALAFVVVLVLAAIACARVAMLLLRR